MKVIFFAKIIGQFSVLYYICSYKNIAYGINSYFYIGNDCCFCLI